MIPPVTPENAVKTAFFESGAPNLTPTGIDDLKVDVDLQTIVERWSELPDAIKAGILAMVMASSGDAVGWGDGE